MSVADLPLERLDESGERRGESPLRRGVRQLLRKRVAVIAMILIFIIYGAGMYTLLDAFGLPTGLQDPQAQNLSVRRPVRALSDGGPEPLSDFLVRNGATLEQVRRFNPDRSGNGGALTPGTRLRIGTALILEPDRVLEGPSWDHLLGTDRLGRDLFSRTLFAARTTIVVTVLAFLFGNVFLGLGLGLLAGYRRGWVDAVIMRVGDVTLAIPGILALIVISAAFRDRWTGWFADVDAFFGTTFLVDQGVDDLSLIFFAFSLFGWVFTARFVRAQVLALREEEYILAAESIGAGTLRILFRHLLPGVLPWIIVGISASLGAMAGVEVALTFLGIGVQPPTASFGIMISAAGGVRTLNSHPHLLLVPGVTVAVLIYSFNLLGDAINDVVNPRGT